KPHMPPNHPPLFSAGVKYMATHMLRNGRAVSFETTDTPIQGYVGPNASAPCQSIACSKPLRWGFAGSARPFAVSRFPPTCHLARREFGPYSASRGQSPLFLVSCAIP